MNLTELAASLVAKSIIGGSGLSISQMSEAISSIHKKLRELEAEENCKCACSGSCTKETAPSKKHRRRKDIIVCLECGKEAKVLTARHLYKVHGLTPRQYRKKHGLPEGLPLTCRSLRLKRRRVALEKDLASNMLQARRAGR